jgi:hypothetical protein
VQFDHSAQRRVLILIFGLLLLVANPKSEASTSKPTVAEQRLLRAVLAGHEMDYGKLPDSERTISGEFLQQLMFDTEEKKVPGGAIRIKSAIIQYFDSDRRINKKIPFEMYFDSCAFSVFSCTRCIFARGVHFNQSYFGHRELVLEGASIGGDFDFFGANLATVSIRKANIHGDVRASLTATSDFLADEVKAQTIRIDAGAPTTLAFQSAKAGELRITIVGDQISGVGINGATIDEISISSTAPLDLNAARANAKSVFMYTSTADSPPHDSKWLEGTELDLTRTVVERNLYVGIEASSIAADGLTVKESATFNTTPHFIDLSFGVYDSFSWSLHPNVAVKLNGITFRILNVSSDAGMHPQFKDALTFLSRAEASSTAFAAYQVQLKTQGDNPNAEGIYIAMHEYLRKLQWHHWITWPLAFVDLFQQYVLGFGHSPLPPMLWSLVFIVVGGIIFRKKDNMEAKVDKPSTFSGAWYSLELFLPIVDLGVAKEWRPKSESGWRVAYARVHQMAGWILVPVALAATTGVVK